MYAGVLSGRLRNRERSGMEAIRGLGRDRIVAPEEPQVAPGTGIRRAEVGRVRRTVAGWQGIKQSQPDITQALEKPLVHPGGPELAVSAPILPLNVVRWCNRGAGMPMIL